MKINLHFVLSFKIKDVHLHHQNNILNKRQYGNINSRFQENASGE